MNRLRKVPRQEENRRNFSDDFFLRIISTLNEMKWNLKTISDKKKDIHGYRRLG